ncbi:IclR family transcriptional regulator [Raineyella sp. LH-20]|uniref:IclR family transcriptional regulator n=1 Tax=Raineyella sp. LH-20 TaxID=3081204 RepID=UPI002954BD01|nr:IclR family transcriptional regulator [Raineyella sp. LH-20]WOP18858.1 IclR family transcriptional regulator [Raineyella sp. LH-20]
MSPTPIESVARSIAVLRELASAGPGGLTLTELAKAVGLHKTTVYRLVSTLRLDGFATQDEASGLYALGPGAVALGRRFTESDLSIQLHPTLTAISRAAGELTHLGVLAGDSVVYVGKVEPDRAVQVRSQIGTVAKAATTALGRALLAARKVPMSSLGAYVADDGVAHLASELDFCRTHGYSRELEENEPEVACIAMAVWDASTPVAAISITAPAVRMTDDRQAELAEIMRREGARYLPAPLALAAPHD